MVSALLETGNAFVDGCLGGVSLSLLRRFGRCGSNGRRRCDEFANVFDLGLFAQLFHGAAGGFRLLLVVDEVFDEGLGLGFGHRLGLAGQYGNEGDTALVFDHLDLAILGLGQTRQQFEGELLGRLDADAAGKLQHPWP